MEFIDVKEILKNGGKYKTATIVGWVKTNRNSGKISFLEVNDGTTIDNVQVVYKAEKTKGYEECMKNSKTGSSVLVNGEVKKNEKLGIYEIVADTIELMKTSDDDYPLQKKAHSFEFLRDIAHLRGRTTTIAAIMRVRSKLAFAIHKYFNERDFVWISTPIITSNDAEGAGENFTLASVGGKPFFDKNASLTVSGQLHGEAYAQAFRKIYTFGPTFRAENSHTNRHASEFWMIEPEVAFISLPQLQALIEDFIKYIVNYVNENCKSEIAFFAQEKPHILKRIEYLINDEFKHVDYAEGIKLLKEAIKNGHEFKDNEIFFGKDLGSEHERYLCEKVFNSPIFLQNYPSEIKSFYMKENKSDKKYTGEYLKNVSGNTVAATDLLVPGVGEIVGGSQREDNYDLLIEKSKKLGMNISSIQWYLDLRKYGYHSSSGFGLGFERLLMYILDVENIRDTIPFPRTPGNLKF